MNNSAHTITATELRIALTDIYPDANYGSVPVVDQYDAVETYRAFADGGLQAVPSALNAYINCQQRMWT